MEKKEEKKVIKTKNQKLSKVPIPPKQNELKKLETALKALILKFTLKDIIISVIGGILLVIFLAILINAIRSESTIEDLVLRKINEARIENGGFALTESTKLTKWSQRHSLLMRKNNFFSHSDYQVGENILDTPVWYSTQNCPIILTNNQIANCIVKKWKISPTHYTNMLSTNYTLTGVGISCGIFKCLATQQFR